MRIVIGGIHVFM